MSRLLDRRRMRSMTVRSQRRYVRSTDAWILQLSPTDVVRPLDCLPQKKRSGRIRSGYRRRLPGGMLITPGRQPHPHADPFVLRWGRRARRNANAHYLYGHHIEPSQIPSSRIGVARTNRFRLSDKTHLLLGSLPPHIVDVPTLDVHSGRPAADRAIAKPEKLAKFMARLSSRVVRKRLVINGVVERSMAN